MDTGSCRGLKLTSTLHLMPGSRKVDRYLHSSKRLHDVVLNYIREQLYQIFFLQTWACGCSFSLSIINSCLMKRALLLRTCMARKSLRRLNPEFKKIYITSEVSAICLVISAANFFTEFIVPLCLVVQLSSSQNNLNFLLNENTSPWIVCRF